MNRYPKLLFPDDDGEEALHRYQNRYRRQDKIFSLGDRLLGVLPFPKRVAITPTHRSILLAHAGDLGHLLVSIALLPILKHAYPSARIGFLIGSYSAAAVEGHPFIDRVHLVDHWFTARSETSSWQRMWTYYQKLEPAMARELKAEQYDLAFDLHGWRPNYITLLWRAGIPERVAFSRLGFTPLLSLAVDYGYDRRHELEHQLDLLRAYGIPDESLQQVGSVDPQHASSATDKVIEILGSARRICVLHPTGSIAVKDWSLDG